LSHPAVAGVVLFSRNFQCKAQLRAYNEEILDVDAGLLIAVDQEGGPVQRFQSGFTRLPALRSIGACHADDGEAGLALARAHATVMASELLACGIDLSFAPVLDLDRGNRAIGTRAFAADPRIVAGLGRAYVQAMNDCGMCAVLKHFPGHGSVVEDSHDEIPSDPRGADDVLQHDGYPFASLLGKHRCAVMVSHVRYPAVDGLPAGFSRFWIETMLREKIGFPGCVLSDDLAMAGAAGVGDIVARAQHAFAAGCDLALVCDPRQAGECLARWPGVECGPMASTLKSRPMQTPPKLDELRTRVIMCGP